MKDSQQHIDEQIEAYLLGKLTEDQKRVFLKDVKEDSQLAERLKHHQRIQQVIAEESEISAFKSVVGEVIAENRPRKYRIYWRIAAILVVGLVLSFIAYTFFKPVSQLSSKELALAYFEPLPDAWTARGEVDSLAQQAMRFYQMGEYDLAIPILKQLSDAGIPLADLYLGIARLGAGDYAAAQTTWQALAQNETTYPNAILWYSALTQLALDDLEAALPKLRQLSGGDSAFTEKATELLNQLE